MKFTTHKGLSLRVTGRKFYITGRGFTIHMGTLPRPPTEAEFAALTRICDGSTKTLASGLLSL